MQAMLVDSIRPGDWIYEIKFDGYRALALRGGNETRILSRNEKDLGGKFPEVKDAVATLDVQDAIIDGEIVALDDKGRSSFQLLPFCARDSESLTERQRTRWKIWIIWCLWISANCGVVYHYYLRVEPNRITSNPTYPLKI